MQDYKSIKFNNGSILYREGHKLKERWVFQNESLSTVNLHLNISEREVGNDDQQLVVMNQDEELVNIDISNTLSSNYIEIGPFETTQICKIVKAKRCDLEPIFSVEQTPLPIDEQKRISKTEIDSVKMKVLKRAKH
jgi:hypothetical protein